MYSWIVVVIVAALALNGLVSGLENACGASEQMSLAQTEISEPRTATRGGRWDERARVAWTRRLIIIGALIVWEGWMRIAGDSNLIARRRRSRTRCWRIFFPIRKSAAIGLTLVEVVAAYALAVVLGLAIGLFIGAGNFSRRSLYPIILLLYAIPQVVLLPLFTLGFASGPRLRSPSLQPRRFPRSSSTLSPECRT